MWETQAPSVSTRIWPMCSRLLHERWHDTLPHLNERTAHRHIFVNEKLFQVTRVALHTPLHCCPAFLLPS